MHDSRCDCCHADKPVLFVQVDGQRRLLCWDCWNNQSWNTGGQLEYGGWTYQLKAGFGNGGTQSCYCIYSPDGKEQSAVATVESTAEKLCATYAEPAEQFRARMRRKR